MKMKVDNYNPENHNGYLPVRVLGKNIEERFLNINPTFRNEFEKLLTQFEIEKKIIIEIHFEPIISNDLKQLPFINSSDKIIHLHEAFLAYLWILCYSFLVIYDEGMNKPARNLHHGENLTIDVDKRDEAFVLFNYGLSLISCYTNWNESLPNPENYDDSNLYIEKANAIFEYAVAFILAHEFAHLKHGHIGLNKEKGYENEADFEASELLLNTISKSEEKTKIGFGLLVATASTLFIDNTLQSNTHPDKDDRIKNVLQKLELDELDNLWGIACLVFTLWEHTHNYQLKEPYQIVNYKVLFNFYLEQLELLKDKGI
jgi:hypothetical protein